MMRTSPLTPDEQEQLRITRAEWLAVGLSTEPADRPEAESAVKDLYAIMGWKEPMIVWMDSPLGGAYAAAWFESIGKEGDQLWDQLRDQLWDQLRDQLGGQIRGQLWGQLWDQLQGQLWDQLQGQLWDQLQGQLWDQLQGQLGGQLGGQLRGQLQGQLGGQLGGQLRGQLQGQLQGQLRGQLRDQLQGQLGGQLRGQLQFAWWGQHDAYWIAWLRFAREVGANYDQRSDAGLEAWSRITRSCGWWWPREGVVILTERHNRVLRHPDGSGRLHCEDGPAVSYPDGYELYAWRGLRVPKEAITEPLTVAQITDEQNAELRRAYMEIYGQHRYMRDAGGELLDEVHEPAFPGLIDARLWRLPHDPEPLVCVECRNSTPEPDGTYKTYALWVDPKCETAHEALAWTFDLPAEDYAPAVET